MTSSPSHVETSAASEGSALDERVARHLAALDAESGSKGAISRRKEQGSHYTPPALVDFIIAEALEGWTWAVRSAPPNPDLAALDPACGSGNFLVATARALSVRLGEPIAETIARRIHGIDVDPVAVGLAREALAALVPKAADRAPIARALERNLVVGDALADDLDAALERRLGRRSFDLIVGNPPFLGQLKRGTAASRDAASRIAARTDGAVRRYADLAGAFLLTSLSRLAPSGRLGFVMPLSFLSTRDSRGVRDAALGHGALRSIWAARESLFDDASVRVAAVVFEKVHAGPPASLRRAFGPDFAHLGGAARAPEAGDETWSPVLSVGFGAPDVAWRPVASGRSIGAIARVTADFRDQYYGLRGAIVEESRDAGPATPRLVTTRHLELAACRWGACEVRILGERWRRPVVDVARLGESPAMRAWLEARRVPKVLVATQTRVIEAWIDAEGGSVPLVPLLVATPRTTEISLARLAAAIASPVVAARAYALYAGSALSAGAIKLSAKQLMAMPIPEDEALWDESAAHFMEATRRGAGGVVGVGGGDSARRRALDAFALRSCEAHALSRREADAILAFWRSRVG